MGGAEAFQSHFGLILSHFRWWVRKSLSVPFNPILVWFYLDKVYAVDVSFPDFQSHFGLILSRFYNSELHEFHAAFNPILVWFYPRCNWFCTDNWWVLSIPFWSDFILQLVLKIIMNSLYFQSHFGLILSHCVLKIALLHHLSFNPILVWFYHPERGQVKLPEKSFQSHFGLILSLNF